MPRRRRSEKVEEPGTDVSLVPHIDIDHGYLVLYEQDESPRSNKGHVLKLKNFGSKAEHKPLFPFGPSTILAKVLSTTGVASVSFQSLGD